MTDEKPWDEAVKWWDKSVADRVRGPMEIRDRPEMKIMVPDSTANAEAILKKILKADTCGYVDVSPDSLVVDVHILWDVEDSEFVLRLLGYDDVYIDRFFSR